MHYLKKHNILPLIIMTSLLSGCNGNQSKSDLISFVEHERSSRLESKKNAKPVKPAIPEPVVYDADLRREPFSGKTVVEQKKNVTTLQAYPLEDLNFVGTITENNIVYAYIVAPDKMLYQVKAGDAIGDKNGVVSKITRDRLDVTENPSDDSAIKRTISLRLKE